MHRQEGRYGTIRVLVDDTPVVLNAAFLFQKLAYAIG